MQVMMRNLAAWWASVLELVERLEAIALLKGVLFTLPVCAGDDWTWEEAGQALSIF